MSTEGKKFDAEKTDMSLLSSIAMYKIADVMTFGKKKYSANNWRGGIVYSRLIGAALRHIFSWLGGESLDPETGKSHLAHAACCIMMLLEFETTRKDLDDRYVAPQARNEKWAESIEKAIEKLNEHDNGSGGTSIGVNIGGPVDYTKVKY